MNSIDFSKAMQPQDFAGSHRSQMVRGIRPLLVVLSLLALMLSSTVEAAGYRKLDPELSRRAAVASGRTSEVVVRLEPGASLPASLQRYVRGPRLQLIEGYVLSMPDSA